MIFAPPRFVVVDDKPEHLKAILDVFQGLGSPCMGIHFDPAKAIDKTLFAGVRVLFMDLHLVDGAATTDQSRHYANIVNLLETNLSEQGGPYILVIWSEHPQHRDELASYLERALPADRHYLHPLAVLALSKTKFINVATGATQDSEALKKAVTEAVQKTPQLSALLTWEADVLSATGETLAALQSLVPASSRSNGAFPQALDDILSLLAREAVGKHNVKVDPRAALNGVLVPILADRILNAETNEAVSALWKKAITRADDDKLPEAATADAANINRMLHVALPSGEKISPDAWGAVLEFPDSWWTNEVVLATFDFDKDRLLTTEYKIKPDKVAEVRPRLIRIGAACDHAQKRPGPVPFIFGLEMPLDARAKGSPPGAEWRSPVLVTHTGGTPFLLAANARFIWGLTQKQFSNFKVSYRLREQLLMQLVTHSSAYSGRPGIIAMPA